MDNSAAVGLAGMAFVIALAAYYELRELKKRIEKLEQDQDKKGKK